MVLSCLNPPLKAQDVLEGKVLEPRAWPVAPHACQEVLYHLILRWLGEGTTANGGEHLRAIIIVRNRNHVLHQTALRLVRDGEEILLLLLPPRSAFGNVAWDSGAEQFRGGVRGGGLLAAPFPAGLCSLVAEEKVRLDLVV